MSNRILKKTALLVIMGVTIKHASAQVYFKVGDNPFTINGNAVLEVESTNKGFLPPRMTKVQRDAIIGTPASPIPPGLQVWCTDCNISTDPPSGELSVYLGMAWAPFVVSTVSRLTTGKRTDLDNKPVRLSATSATIKGTLVSTSGVLPTETGVVYREVSGNDFATLPVINDSGTATAPNYKVATSSPVTTEGGAISVTIPSFSSTATPKRPFIFRTYAVSASGISYGNPVIFNADIPPAISNPVVTKGDSLFPTFAGTLTVAAGSFAGTVTEYGYYTGASNPPTENKVVISDAAAITALDTKLNADSFTADPTVDLAVNDYNVTASSTTYFRYYALVNGQPVYSNAVSFTPPNLVTGGDAEATVKSSGTISGSLKIGEDAGNRTVAITFAVTKPGTYKFESVVKSGATKGVSIPTVSGRFDTTGDKTVTFAFSGTPVTSLEGNTFGIAKGGTVSTGLILPHSITGGSAVATVGDVEDLTTATPLKIGAAGSGTFKVHFNVTSAGSYDSFSAITNGITTGLGIVTVPAGNFVKGDNVLNFVVIGTPDTSLDGNTFDIRRTSITLSTGRINLGDMIGGKATCDALHKTTLKTVTTKTGKIWMDRNLGASRVAESADDFEAFGCLFQYGRGDDGHASITWSSSTSGTPVNGKRTDYVRTIPPNTNLFINSGPHDWYFSINDNWLDGNTAWGNLNRTPGSPPINNPCPSGYRPPSNAEFENEKNSYNITNAKTAWESDLKLPKNGIRNKDDGNVYTGRAFYWERDLTNVNIQSRDFSFNDSQVFNDDKNVHANGFSVRCIKN